MRTDVKLGLVVSVVVVGFAGWYLMNFGGEEPAIPINHDDPVLAGTETQSSKQPRVGPSSTSQPSRRSTPPARTADGRRLDRSPGRVARGTTGKPAAQGQPQPQADTPNLADLFKPDSRKTAGRNLADAGKSDPRSSAGKSQAVAGGHAGNRRAAKALSLTGRPANRRPAERSRMEQHTVKTGDTILELARLYYGNTRYAKALLDANPQLANTADLPVGAVINIPDVEITEPTSAVRSTAARKRVRPGPVTPQAAPQRKPAQRTYTVVEGDTLYGISLEKLGQGTRWQEIHELNKAVIGDDPAFLKPGMVIKLPRARN